MKHLTLIASFLSILFVACKKTGQEPQISKPQITGVVQKGPFLNGTSITIYELTTALAPTGKTYVSQLLDNSGSFQVKDVVLASQYVQLKADGFYFNEVTGRNSVSPITLYALTDIQNRNTVNVNILSHLEKGRVEHLTGNGLSFDEARKKASAEVLKIFGITKTDIKDFESLDIASNSEDNAILLAVSLILQGFRTEAELSDLLANISTDIRQDGILNSASLGSLLINDSRFFKLAEIRSNIVKRYSDLGINATIPDFEKYVNAFVANSGYQPTNNIVYPAQSNAGENVLYGEKTDFTVRGNVSLAAKLPYGASLKIVMKEVPGVPLPSIGFQYGTYVNWNNTPWTQTSPREVTFTNIETGKDCDVRIGIVFPIPGNALKIEYYENGATSPTRTKTINL